LSGKIVAFTCTHPHREDKKEIEREQRTENREQRTEN
jgi:hypothetical protein